MFINQNFKIKNNNTGEEVYRKKLKGD